MLLTHCSQRVELLGSPESTGLGQTCRDGAPSSAGETFGVQDPEHRGRKSDDYTTLDPQKLHTSPPVFSFSFMKNMKRDSFTSETTAACRLLTRFHVSFALHLILRDAFVRKYTLADVLLSEDSSSNIFSTHLKLWGSMLHVASGGRGGDNCV